MLEHSQYPIVPKLCMGTFVSNTYQQYFAFFLWDQRLSISVHDPLKAKINACGNWHRIAPFDM